MGQCCSKVNTGSGELNSNENQFHILKSVFSKLQKDAEVSPSIEDLEIAYYIMLKLVSILTFKKRFALLKTHNMPASIMISMYVSAAAFTLVDTIYRCFGDEFPEPKNLDVADYFENNPGASGNPKMASAYNKDPTRMHNKCKSTIETLRNMKMYKISRVRVGKNKSSEKKLLHATQKQDKIRIFKCFQYNVAANEKDRRSNLAKALYMLGEETEKHFNREISKVVNSEDSAAGKKFISLKTRPLSHNRESKRVERFSVLENQDQDYMQFIHQAFVILGDAAYHFNGAAQNSEDKILLDVLAFLLFTMDSNRMRDHSHRQINSLFCTNDEFLLSFEVLEPHFVIAREITDIINNKVQGTNVVLGNRSTNISEDFNQEVVEEIARSNVDESKRFKEFFRLLFKLKFKFEY